MADERNALRISTNDIREYLHRQSQMCDSCIEDAYMKLSQRHDERIRSTPATSDHFERRTASFSGPTASSRKHVSGDNVTRPSSAHEHRSKEDQCGETPRGILKRTDSPIGNPSSRRHRTRESPDEWFQRIMHVKKVSPLDLCDLFSYGDARKHPLVPLSHVCEVLFDLDPESLNGADPVTDEMEDFLYQFATEEGGENMVNIREALRALDIWQYQSTSSGARIVPSKLAFDPQSKAAILESKNKKLKDTISNLQNENLRLSSQLESVKLALSPNSKKHSASSASPTRSQTGMKSASVAEASPAKTKTTSPSKSREFSPSKSQKVTLSTTQLKIVNLHEQELVEIASKLQFTGVRKLERMLIHDDADSTGFVSVKQLSSLLADQFELKVSEVRLIEVCMGMSFNMKAQLDYKEFVDVLMDILIYALPDIRESAKRKSLIRLDEYLHSGFPPGRVESRQLLDKLCSKYDLEGDQRISVEDLVHVFHVDLVKQHELQLPFPLEQHETIQLAQPFTQRNTLDKSSEGFLSYTELLDAILGPSPISINSGNNRTNQAKRGCRCEFWNDIYMTLCGGDTRMEQKVLAQLNQILVKVDPDATFMISARLFKRIFERHICADEMAILIAALAVHEDKKGDPDDDAQLRYDVLLNLVFGSPALNDERFFSSCIQKKLLHEQNRLQQYLKENILAEGSSSKLTMQDFHDVFIVQAEDYPLEMVGMLFLFGTVDSSHQGKVEVKALQKFLLKGCWTDDKRSGVGIVSTSEGTRNSKSSSVQSNSESRTDRSALRLHIAESQIHNSDVQPPLDGDVQTISSLRVLEISILDISNEFADRKGKILPARAFRYFSFGPTAPSITSPKRTPPSSPLRRSSLSNRGAGSVTIRKKQRELAASSLDPLTPAVLKKTLQTYHNIQASTHLISQFFLHIGSTSKHFLDLLHFAQWTAPLSVELQIKVRGVVRQMIVKGKGGGGRLDLDRFLAQLQRRLHESPQYMANIESNENLPLQFVSMSLLVSKLHQLNIPLHKHELMALLRHFGMETSLDHVDYALFLQRLYELNSSMGERLNSVSY